MPREADHGLRSTFARTGGEDEHSLTEPQRSRLVELREELSTPEGVEAVALRQAGDAESIREAGAAYFHELGREMGVKAFGDPMLTRYFTAAESARRSLLVVHQLQHKADGGLSAKAVLAATRGDGWRQTELFSEQEESESDDTTD